MSIKTLSLLSNVLLGLLLMPTTYAGPSDQKQNSNQTVILNVQNMTCPMCKFTIKKALSSVLGTENISINYAKKTATVTFNPQQTNSDALIKAITNAGYPATVQSTKE